MQEHISRALIVWVCGIRATTLDSHIKTFGQVWRTQLRLSPFLPACLPFLWTLCNLIRHFHVISRCRYRVKFYVSETVHESVFRNFQLAMVIFDEKLLRIILGLKTEEVKRENCINKSFTICRATLGGG
jgi:hypothetical protein